LIVLTVIWKEYSMKFSKICILGLGYIGLPTAATFATHGVRVVGVDVNPNVLSTLRRGEVHIHEDGLREVLEEALKTGNLTVKEAPVEADAFIIAVPTPFYEDKIGTQADIEYKLADMRAVTSATEAILPVLQKGNLVVLESTSPPRTTIDLLIPILERSGLKAGTDFYLAYSPERVLPGQILRELIENARVIGGINPASEAAGKELYEIFVKGKIITSDATTAEMVKLMENTYRDVNIAIANEFARLADRFGVDVWEAISIANLHPRVKILNPGPGVGGHCISVDPWFFVEAAPDLSPLIHAARKVNDSQPQFALDLVRKAAGNLKGKKIAALGLAFKPEVDDLRESPAVEVVHLLQSEGAIVKAYEPFKPDAALKGIITASTLAGALVDAEVVILLVNHSELRALTPEKLAALTPARILVDMVNGWAGKDWMKAGFKIHLLGVNK
jgi:UDP-N-acetyl-D-mannosaminuronic acid dehydrogenase